MAQTSSVSTAKLQALSVTGDKIGVQAVSANNIVNNSITELKIADPVINGLLFTGT